MLNIIQTNPLPTIIQGLVTEFRRVQVSRFPIDVEASAGSSQVRFVDSRFAGRGHGWHITNTLAILNMNGFDKNYKPLIKMTSKRINNEKYSAHNSEYHTRVSSDPKKVLKWMKDYIKPYTPQEVAERTRDRAFSAYDTWQTQASDAMSGLTYVREEELYEEIGALVSVGVQFRTDKFRKLAEEGLPAYLEKQARRKADKPATHVIINPDDSVVVTDKYGATTYDSFDMVPQDIQQQVSLLRMMEADQYLPEVGIRFDKNVFWVNVQK
jgi:hypothetical protein